jgi:hypothetical protein
MLCVFAACASGAGGKVGGKAPEWVTSPRAVYPENEWLCVVESAMTKQAAQDLAAASLAGVFRLNVRSESAAIRQQSRSYEQSGRRTNTTSAGNAAEGRAVQTSSDVEDIIGMRIDTWAARDGTVYALARINRNDASEQYAAIIKQNERAILSLLQSAEKNPATFDACEALYSAIPLAEKNENMLDILSVLNPEKRKLVEPEYGNAVAIQGALQNTVNAIVISVDIKNDVDGRLAKAFSECFSSRGYRTNTGGKSNYKLSGVFLVEELEDRTDDYYFVRFTLNVALANNRNAELISWSETARRGQPSMQAARQRAVINAEQDIQTVFAGKFDDYLDSLLKK